MFKHHGELIKAIRLSAELHQQSLARIMEISQGQLSKVEKGHQEIGVNAWLMFCSASGVNPFLFKRNPLNRKLHLARKQVISSISESE